MFQEIFSNVGITLSNELTNTLFIAIVYSLVLNDLRKYLAIEKLFKYLEKIKNEFWSRILNNWFTKIIMFIFYYALLITIGLFGLILVLLAFSII